MAYKPEIEVDTVTLTSIRVRLPEFHLEVDGDFESDYTGVFAGPAHDITFYGPTPDHVIGAAHRYARKLTEGAPYNLIVEIGDEDVEDALVELP